ncbi:hypothetical protein JXQ70_19410 [bacterium]|nr:hypothetical protein [bacterium]
MSLSLRLFVVLICILSLCAGFVLAPQTSVMYDTLVVIGVDYGFEQGDYILSRQKMKICRMFSGEGLSFIQEPDGTVHLFTPKTAARTAAQIAKNQSSRLYFVKTLLRQSHNYAHKYLKQAYTWGKSKIFGFEPKNGD